MVTLFVTLFILTTEQIFPINQPYMAKDSFVKVRDASRRPIRNLYKRGPSFYARIAVNKKLTWIRLKAKDIDSAKEEKQAVIKSGPPQNCSVKFDDFAIRYLSLIEKMKKPSTVKGEREQLDNVLTPYFGEKYLGAITPREVEEFRAFRLKKVSPNTVNHNIVVLRNLFKRARILAGVTHDPFTGITQLKFDRKPKTFLPLSNIREVSDWIRREIRCGEVIANAILFLAFTGARWSEGMATRWEDVDWRTEQICIGALGSKGKTFRYIPFHHDLKALLLAIRKSTNEENPKGWLFPTYRTPEEKDLWPLRNIHGALRKARAALKQGPWSPHDLRHHFASRCVMAGIDFKTIAEWLGHKDGGMLVTTTYGHLSPGHGRLQASKLDTLTESNGKKVHSSIGNGRAAEVTLDQCLNISDTIENPPPDVRDRQSKLLVPAKQSRPRNIKT